MNFVDDKEKINDLLWLTREQFLKSYSYITEAEYNNTYKPLLEIKQRTFSEIYDNVQTKADTMLSFWRKH